MHHELMYLGNFESAYGQVLTEDKYDKKDIENMNNVIARILFYAFLEKKHPHSPLPS
jgi:hypothetical protein